MHRGAFLILVATVTVAALELTIEDLVQQGRLSEETTNIDTTTEFARDTTTATEAFSSPKADDVDSTTDDLDVTDEPESTLRPSVTVENISFTTPVVETEAPTTRLTDRTEGVFASNELTNVVDTTYGPVKGFEWQSNENIISYIDIPYAQFADYFKDPTPPSPWENLHEVTEHTSRCPQLQNEAAVGSLDCLTLSIFTPANAMNASVLFHVHESNFFEGSADPAVYGPEYLVAKGLILVLPNYRLGPLGFLCLRNAVAPGNAALKDLSMALKWTKNNIGAFGGNPENIVVSGEGSSGALVGFLSLSPLSRDHFQKAITESGSVLSYWALDRNPIETGERLIDELTNMVTNNRDLETTDLPIILAAAKHIHFRPCTETGTNPFMIQTPWGMIREQKSNITFMIGSANYAGLNAALNQNETQIEQLNDDFSNVLPGDLLFKSDIERENVVRNIRAQYFQENEPITFDDHIEELALCFTDAFYLGPAIREARSLANSGATVYVYELSFARESNTETEVALRPVEGAVRGEIIKYIFTQDGSVLAEGSEEREIVDIMVDTWFSFIENGYPVANGTTWNNLTVTVPAEEEWMFLGPEISLNQGLHLDRLNLWTSIYNNYFVEIRNNGKQPNLNIYTGIVSLITYFGFWRARIAD